MLLKNEGNALPLVKPKSLAIVGQDAIVNPKGANACVDRGCNTGTLAMVCNWLLSKRGFADCSIGLGIWNC